MLFIFSLCSHLNFDLFFYHFLFFYFLLSFRAECWLQPPTDDCNLYSWGPLDPQTGEKKKMQAVNELPSFPSVKGVYKLDPFVRALLCSLSLLLPPCLLLPPLSLLILAPSPPSRPSSCSSIFSLYLPASRSSSSVAGAALSGFGSEQHLLSARFMFRISHLMRTKEINWWFKPNETSVKLTGLINWNK